MRRKTAELRSALVGLLEDLEPGARLPAERDLSRQLGCSRQTLRTCLSALEKDGAIWRHVGQGTFRGPRPRYLPLRDLLLIEGATPPDVMRARMLLEPMVASEAARHAVANDIALLRQKVRQGRQAPDRAACEQADDAFHQALANISRNPVLVGFLGYLSGVRRRVAWQRAWERTYRRIGVEAFRTIHSDQHDRIVDAVERHDTSGASAAMAIHLETVSLDMGATGNSAS
ncbi:MAG: FadR/GntR family transcriptional regulator [Paracoccus sp. (in: a-proteobacteria)]|jgi:DNA-binding FadR family transcriptional regulator|uniref:FCD domain-containing protein n=1 Tax=Paracoccus maritimus TaxID=2933292 RepID=A0ABT2KCS1_9RHOB|nr:FCD domain-containing protein [Paracoccus sp. YLB-12]MAM39871.1 GntR family transcriptional regulator [Erythrobacter sp.]MCT4334344.1 FCD domain-containing protein [Paracoccus sp. YLB-12]|tara:strand:+ start:109 stop:798 length:690 start_codon:yes stop_codon:yes gene_type:complete